MNDVDDEVRRGVCSVSPTSIAKQNEGCIYIGVANKLFDTLSLRILLPSALMRGNLIRFAFSLQCVCTFVRVHVHVSVTLRNVKLLCLGITVHVHNEWKTVHCICTLISQR